MEALSGTHQNKISESNTDPKEDYLGMDLYKNISADNGIPDASNRQRILRANGCQQKQFNDYTFDVVVSSPRLNLYGFVDAVDEKNQMWLFVAKDKTLDANQLAMLKFLYEYKHQGFRPDLEYTAHVITHNATWTSFEVKSHSFTADDIGDILIKAVHTMEEPEDDVWGDQ
jgi:hypothetical protein